MLTHFEKPEESKELYFKLSNSFHLTMFDDRSSNSKFAGLYAIYKNDVCMYVGQSQNLASRLSQHLSGKYESADKVLIFSAISNGFEGFFDFPKEDRRWVLENNEKLLIKELQPIENLMLPEDDYDLGEHHQFNFFDMKVESSEYIETWFSSKLYLYDHHITVTSDDDVCSVRQDGFFKQYNSFIKSMDGLNNRPTKKGGL